MRTPTLALVLTAGALVSTAVAFGQVRPAAPSRTITVDECHPGMTGYGLTVFHGTQPERFPVVVVDILHNFRPHMDMVLVRPSHPILAEAATVAGMSGSPIYIDGRLLGAYAYGWDFGRDPVAGVTPIDSMTGESRRMRRTPPGLIPGAQVPLPIVIDEPAGDRPQRRGSWDRMREAMGRWRRPAGDGDGTSMVPLSVPFGVSGMGPHAFAALSESLAPFGIVPVQSGGTGTRTPNDAPPPEPVPAHYEPGGSVSISLMSGDISGASTGTVTAIDGASVLAFGHPMMGLGEVALPAARSRVAWISPSFRRSMKLAEAIAPLGALVQDRPTTIVLDEHAVAPTVPVHVRIARGNESGPINDWNVRVAYHRAMLGRLVGSMYASVVETAIGDTGDVAWTVHSHVRTHGHGTLDFTDHGVSLEGTSQLTLGTLGIADALERLTDNTFEQVRVEQVEAEIELHWARDFFYVRNVSLARAEVDPGDTVDLVVSLGQYAGAAQVRHVPVPIPRELAGRDVDLEVAAGGETVPDLAEPESIGDLLHNITVSYPDDALVVSLRMPGQGVTLRGRVIRDLPGSALDALRPAASTDGGDPFVNVRRSVVPVGRLVLGRDRVRVHVREVRR